MFSFSRVSIPGYEYSWILPLSFNSILDHIILFGEFETRNINAVIWSLIHEMRVSIIFPFIVYFILRLNWKGTVLLPLLIPVVIVTVYYFLLKAVKIDISSLIWNPSSHILTIHYLSVFTLYQKYL